MGLLRNQSHWFKWGDPVSVFFLSPSHNIENTEPHFSLLRHHGAKMASHKKQAPPVRVPVTDGRHGTEGTLGIL